MDINSLLSTVELDAIHTNNDLFSSPGDKIHYSDRSEPVLLENYLTLKDDINSPDDLFLSQDSLVTELDDISTDYASVNNYQATDPITGESIEPRSINKSDNSIKTATYLGEISSKKLRINEKIGFKEGGKRDKNDYYSFTLTEDNEVNISLDKLKKNANLHLFDENGKTVLDKSTRKGKKSENITEDLDAGSYYLRVSAAGRAETPYRLTLETVPDDNTIDGANDLGKLSNKKLTAKDKIGFKEGGERDKVDFYTFDINQDRKVDITLNKLKGNANIKLIDEDGETVLDKSSNKGKKSEQISEVLEPGSYYLEVSARGNAKTNYQLSLNSEKIDINDVVFSPKKEETYKAGTWLLGENRVGLQIPKGWVGGVTNNYDDTFILTSPKKYPDVYVEVESENYLTGSMKGLANNWSQPFERDGVTFQPQGKANRKGKQVTNTYIPINSELQGKFYVVSTVGPNNEIATVIVGGTENKLKDYKDIANHVVENLDFPEPTDWESYLSDRWLSSYYNSDWLEIDWDFNGVIDSWEEYLDEESSMGIFLYGDGSFNHFHDSYHEITGTTGFYYSGTWDITNKNELVLYYEYGSVSVEPIFGPDLDNEVMYRDLVFSVHNINW